MQNNRTIWLIVLSTVLFLGAALVTLRAAEQASRPTAAQVSGPAARAPASSNPATSLTPGMQAAPATTPAARPATRAASAAGATSAPRAKPTHPPASAPEESATITDDPTTAPDPSQSADNNVSFPTDI
jgi:hypothetical protein